MTIEQMNERKRELGYTYEQIAELTGLPVSTVQKVLGGFTKSPRYETIAALENLLEEPVSYSPMVKEAAPVYGAIPQPREKKQGEYTIEDYYAIPDERRVELIKGVIYDMSAPTAAHQLIAGCIYNDLSNYIRANKGKCIPMIAPSDVQINCDDRTMVQPDVYVLCDRHKMRMKNIYGAPDFIVEVLSPSTRKKDMNTKLALYVETGVREYWLVDPDKKKVLVYELEKESLDYVTLYTFDDQVPVGIFNGKCKIDFKEIYDYISFLYEEDEEEA